LEVSVSYSSPGPVAIVLPILEEAGREEGEEEEAVEEEEVVDSS
jgi:hypothetical protein